MSTGFDPYRKWLGLDASSAPPDHYRLLGLEPFESNAARIKEAADRKLAHVRGQRPGEHSQAWAQLLDEIAAAKQCLTNDGSREAYDQQLRRAADGSGPSPSKVTPWPAPPTEGGPSPGEPASGPNSAQPENPLTGPSQDDEVIPGFPQPSSTPVPAPLVDPMAPLDLSSVPAPSSIPVPLASADLESAPIPGFSNVASQADPMAAVPGFQPAPVPVAHPVAAPAQPAAEAVPPLNEPVASPTGPSTPSAASSPPAVAPAPGNTTVAAPLQVAPKRPKNVRSRSRSSSAMPIYVGVGVGLAVLAAGGLYVFLKDQSPGPEVAHSHQQPAAAATQTTATTGAPNPGSLSGNQVADALGSQQPSAEPGWDDTRAVTGVPGPGAADTDFPDFGGADTDDPSMDAERPDHGTPQPDSGATSDPASMPEPGTQPNEPPGPAPEPPAPMPPQPSREELVQLGTRLKSARMALAQHDFGKAEELLEEAEPPVMRAADREKLENLRLLLGYAAGFHEAIIDGVSKLQAGESLQLENSAIGIVETSPDLIVLRVNGMNRRYMTSELPLGLAVVLAHQAVSPTDASTIAHKASFVLTSPLADAKAKAKARDWFAEAAATLPDVADLADVMTDNYNLVAGAEAPAAMTPPPASTEPDVQPTRDEVKQLASVLGKARKAIAARNEKGVTDNLEAARAVAKTSAHQQMVWRLEQLAEQVTAFDQALQEAVSGLKAGDTIQVGSSTELTVARVSPETLGVEVAGLKKSYPLNNLPLGLAVALLQTRLPADDPATKAIQAGFVVVSKNSNDRSLAKARTWYEESAAGDPDLADMVNVIDDDYDLLQDFQER